MPSPDPSITTVTPRQSETLSPIIDALWRSFLLFVTSLWTGGLTFYAAVVIHTAAAVLGSESTVGFITQRVTNSVNVLACLALPLLLIDHLQSPPSRLRRATLLVWSLLVVLQVPMLALHPVMDRLLNPADFSIADFSRFHPMHQVYLWLASIQILTFPVYFVLFTTLWRRRDAAPDSPTPTLPRPHRR